MEKEKTRNKNNKRAKPTYVLDILVRAPIFADKRSVQLYYFSPTPMYIFCFACDFIVKPFVPRDRRLPGWVEAQFLTRRDDYRRIVGWWFILSLSVFSRITEEFKDREYKFERFNRIVLVLLVQLYVCPLIHNLKEISVCQLASLKDYSARWMRRKQTKIQAEWKRLTVWKKKKVKRWRNKKIKCRTWTLWNGRKRNKRKCSERSIWTLIGIEVKE